MSAAAFFPLPLINGVDDGFSSFDFSAILPLIEGRASFGVSDEFFIFISKSGAPLILTDALLGGKLVDNTASVDTFIV